MSKTGKMVQTIETRMAFVLESQNRNSGSLRMNGRNSSSSPIPYPLALVGSPGAPSSTSTSAASSWTDGSNFGCRNARKRSALVSRAVTNVDRLSR